MNKYQIFIDKKENLTDKTFNEQLHNLLTHFCDSFHAIKYAIHNNYVNPAKPLQIITSNHPRDAVVSIWHTEKPSKHFLDKVSTISDQHQLYQLDETLVLHQQEKVGSVNGLCQIALLQKPEKLSRKEWLHNWQDLHTNIAIDTQSNFIYRQNICIDTESQGHWPALDAVVEEVFPAEAMTDRQVFFNAKGDEENYKSNERKMIESCMRFIDFTKFDCLPMQEIVIKPLSSN